MRLVVALGGNALLRRGETPDIETQRAHLRDATASLAELARLHDLVITHGNGPQVGLLASQAQSRGESASLAEMGALSEGLIGFLLEQELRSALPGREVVTLLTLVAVDPDDPTFALPRKPIGPVYAPGVGRRLARGRGWTMAAEREGLRRIVASPAPVRILPIEAIRRLVDSRRIVVCGGGGGIPVVEEPGGGLRGAEAVIDKDRTAALLAEGLRADGLVILTDVPGVCDDFGTPDERLLREVEPGQLASRSFEAGSMGPKIEAACRFVERTGGWAAIGALEAASAVVAGTAGTRIAVPRAVAPVLAAR
jgi:carbamate kinase